MALLHDEPRAATVVAVEQLVCLSLERQTFTRLLGPLRELLDTTAERRGKQIGSIKLEQLEVRQLLGVGSFASVKLAIHTPSGTPYALKMMSKGMVLMTSQVRGCQRPPSLHANARPHRTPSHNLRSPHPLTT